MDEQKSSVQPASSSSEDGDTDTASLALEVEELKRLRLDRVRFRVLIIGRANAGKTTILERLCDSSAEKAIVYRDGRVVKGLKIKGEQGRGEHNISDEIVFPSLPGFVFHDSRGVESGGTDEKSKIEDFVKAHSTSVTGRNDILHAVWICLPLDTDRPLLEGELELCKISVQHVPVIAIFTKRDARYTKVLAEIKSESTASGRAALIQARAETDRRVDEWVKTQVDTLKSQTRRLSNHILAPNMQKADEDCKRFCNSLISCTEEALPTAILKSLLTVVWVNNASELSFRIFRRVLELSQKRSRFSAKISQSQILEIVQFYLPAYDYDDRRPDFFDDRRDVDDVFDDLICRRFELFSLNLLGPHGKAKEPRDADIILFMAFCILVKREIVLSCLRAPPRGFDAYKALHNEVMDSPATAAAYRQLSDRIITSYGPGGKGRDIRMGPKEEVETIARRLVEIIEECLEKYD